MLAISMMKFTWRARPPAKLRCDPAQNCRITPSVDTMLAHFRFGLHKHLDGHERHMAAMRTEFGT
jgi:hypothetical protein